MVCVYGVRARVRERERERERITRKKVPFSEQLHSLISKIPKFNAACVLQNLRASNCIAEKSVCNQILLHLILILYYYFCP
jgi:hypothetical protein